MNQTFEEKMKGFAALPKEEMEKQVAQLKNVCKDYCGKCPTYKGTKETDFGFCAIGKSKKITKSKGCLCKSCPITKNMSLRWEYYCKLGSGSEQSAKEKKK